MAGESEKTEDAIVTEGADEEPQKVSDDELQVLQSKAARLDAMDEIASEMAHDTAEDYIDTLEHSMAEQIDTTAPDKAPEKTKPAAPAAPANNPDYDKAISQNAANNTATAQNASAALMESQFATYEIRRMKQPKEEQSSYTKEELLKVLRSPKRHVIKEMVAQDSDHGGNFFRAAEYFLDNTQGKSEERKAGAESEKALNRAKTTAALDRGRAAPGVDTTESDENDDFADELSPPDEIETA